MEANMCGVEVVAKRRVEKPVTLQITEPVIM